MCKGGGVGGPAHIHTGFILFMESTKMTCRDQLLIVDAV